MEVEKINVNLSGLADIMFNRFIDHSKEQRPPEQKLYLTEENQLVLPAENIYSFLFCENPPGCAKSFEGKRSKEYLRIGQGHVFVDPLFIPFNRNGKPIKFEGFNQDIFWIHESAPRTKQGNLSIKQEIQKRPVLHVPWELEFTINLIKNQLINSTKLYNWFVAGGIQIALGAYRPRFGRFAVESWD